MTRPKVTDEEVAVILPQYNEVYRILRNHPLGARLDDLAALLTLKVIAITWGQVREVMPAPVLPLPGDGPDDGGFYLW